MNEAAYNLILRWLEHKMNASYLKEQIYELQETPDSDRAELTGYKNAILDILHFIKLLYLAGRQDT